MSLESEARKQLEAQRRAAQEQERQRLAQQQAREARNRAQDREMERVKSEAILKFRGLNPERLLEEVRRAWHTGRIVPFSDPLYKEHNNRTDLDGVMLYQRGNAKHSSVSEKGEYPYHSSDGFQPAGRSSVWKPGHTVDTESYPIDMATISLHKEGSYSNTRYFVGVVDFSGQYVINTTRTKTGLFSSDKSIEKHLSDSDHSRSHNFGRSFDIGSVRPEDIHAVFVEATARRMAGAGNLKIR